MDRALYRYRFEKDVPMKEARESLLLSVLAAECLHGEARVRLDADYRFGRAKRSCVIDASTEVGRDICRIFTGFAIKEFGEDAFRVERILRNRENAAAGKEDCLEG
jgi:hypothetical protein